MSVDLNRGRSKVPRFLRTYLVGRSPQLTEGVKPTESQQTDGPGLSAEFRDMTLYRCQWTVAFVRRQGQGQDDKIDDDKIDKMLSFSVHWI